MFAVTVAVSPEASSVNSPTVAVTVYVTLSAVTVNVNSPVTVSANV